MAFAQFSQAGKADTPNFAGAQAADDRMDEAVKRRNIEMMGQTLKGAPDFYENMTGADSPFASLMGESEAMSGALRTAPDMLAAPTAETASSLLDPTLLSEMMNPATQATLGAGEGVLAPVAGETIASIAAPTAAEALTASALGTEALGVGAGALAPAAGAGLAGAAGTVLPPLGAAILLGSMFDMF